MLSFIKRQLQQSIIAGLLVLVPTAGTVLVVWKLIDAVDRMMPAVYQPENLFGVKIPGWGLFTVLVLVLVIGALTRNILGTYLLRISEKIMNHIPVARSVYGVIKQILSAFLKDSSNAFSRVVLIEYPKTGIWTVAFVTGQPEEDLSQHVAPEGVISVFVPTTPNPTSGFYLLVEERNTKPLKMSVERALKLIISVGVAQTEEALEKASQTVAGTKKEPKEKKQKIA